MINRNYNLMQSEDSNLTLVSFFPLPMAIIIIIITLSTEVSEHSNCRLVPY